MKKPAKGAFGQIVMVTTAWGNLRPTKSFSGYTLEQFRESVKASHDVRAEIADLRSRLQAAMARRDAVDIASLETVRNIVNGVKGDRGEGENGELYAAMGYVRKSLRGSGLTRRRTEGAVPPVNETS